MDHKRCDKTNGIRYAKEVEAVTNEKKKRKP